MLHFQYKFNQLSLVQTVKPQKQNKMYKIIFS